MMTLGEAIRLGSLLKKRSLRPGYRWEDRACALQLAALAIGREDIAYDRGGPNPNYHEVAKAFGFSSSADVISIAVMNDAKFHGGTPKHSIEEIATYADSIVKRSEQKKLKEPVPA